MDHFRGIAYYRKTGSHYGRMPAFIRRYNANWDRIDPGYFSVISELVIRLWSRTVRAGLCPGRLHHGHHHANVMRAKIPGSVTLQNRFSLLMRMRAKWGSLGAG
uniref:BstA-like C-terminal domain-containing protein n=1 Tax=Chelativorans sp. (strain BNC1) TaxID=266779 RepID=Q11JC7_CHESB